MRNVKTTICKGTNCTAINGVGHSPECKKEHDDLCFEAAMNDHILHGGWKCRYCGYNGQDNVWPNIFCARCRRRR